MMIEKEKLKKAENSFVLSMERIMNRGGDLSNFELDLLNKLKLQRDLPSNN